MIRVIALALILTGCAHTGPVADGVTTTVGLQAGLQEGNPLIASNPSVMLPLSVAVRVGAMRYARDKPHCAHKTNMVDSMGWGAAFNNLAVMAGVSGGPLIGFASAAIFYTTRRDRFAEYCRPEPCLLTDLPSFATRATCERGAIVAR